MAWTACLVMASCTNQDIIEQVVKPVHSNSLNVVTEKQKSRSVLSYEGTFYWTENDYIGVYGTETENARFHFTSQTDGVSTFMGNMNVSEEKVSWAYFPYSEQVDVNQQQISFPMLAERTVSNENHSPMIGRVEANNTVRFYHTGGILHLKIVGLPEYATQLVITSEGENSPYLAGTAIIDGIAADGCTYRIDNGSKEVVYDVRNLEGGEYIHTIYLPLQVGTYEKIKVTLKNEMGGIIKERSLSNLTVTRGKMTDTPMLNFSTHLYGLRLPKEFLVETEWDDGILFSNELYMLYQNESINGFFCVLANGFNLCSEDNMDIISARFDDEGKINYLNIGLVSYYFYNYTEKTFDVKIMYDDNIECYPNQNLLVKDEEFHSRTVDSPEMDFLRRLQSILHFDFIRPHGTTNTTFESTVNYNYGEILEGTLRTGYGNINPNPITGTYSYVRVSVDIIDGMHKIERSGSYSRVCGNAKVIMKNPQKISKNQYQIGYQLMNDNINLQNSAYSRGDIVSGFLVKAVSKSMSQKAALRNFFVKSSSVQRIEYENELDSKSHILSIDSNLRYYVRAYIGCTLYDTYSYSDNIVEISVDNPIVTKVEESCEYSNGKFCFNIYATGECDNLESNFYMNISRNGENYQEKVWNMHNNQIKFSLELASNDMDYQYKFARDYWNVNVYVERNDILDSKTLILKYDKEPTIDLDVKIIDGPRKISNSRAADDDDEEKYYVKYQVTAKTEGSGWIEQVKINVDGRSMKTGKPENEGESFTYIGSKTYKDKSELPIISCEGILINGAGNIQSVPASINVATKVN